MLCLFLLHVDWSSWNCCIVMREWTLISTLPSSEESIKPSGDRGHTFGAQGISSCMKTMHLVISVFKWLSTFIWLSRSCGLIPPIVQTLPLATFGYSPPSRSWSGISDLFEHLDDLKDLVREHFHGLLPDEYQSAFNAMGLCYQKCIDAGGDFWRALIIQITIALLTVWLKIALYSPRYGAVEQLQPRM